MKLIKQQNVFGWITLASALIALIAMIIYIASSTTGFLAGSVVNSTPIILTVFAIAILVASALLSDKIDGRITGAMLFVAVVLNAVSVCVFVVSRIQIIADVWFIPVNYPETEGTALGISLAGIVFYLISIAATCVAGFAKKLNAL